MSLEREAHRQTLLLALVAVMMAVNTLGLVGTALWFRSELRELTRSERGPLVTLQENLENTRRMARDLTEQQTVMARGLDEVARRTVIELKGLQERRNNLGGLQKGPLDKFDQMISLMQLMSDELLLLLKHVTSLQGVLAKVVRPGDAQLQLTVEQAPQDPPAAAAKDGGTK